MKHHGVFAGLALLTTWSASAQVPSRMLTRAETEFPEPFTRISSLRELPDGRVLVADQRQREIRLLDLGRRTMAAVGRQGAGPREVGIPGALIALPHDTTWAWDPLNNRWLVVDPTGTAVQTIPGRETSIEVTRGDLLGSDADGRIYIQRDASAGREPTGSLGVAHVLRVARDTWRAETVASLRLPPGRALGARSLPGGMIRRINNRPLAPEDVAAIAPDGRVAVIRSPDYRVEWHHPGGQVTSGPAVPYERIPVSALERRAFVAAQTVPGQIVVVGIPGAGGPAPTAHRLPDGALDAEADQLPWPSALPPFGPGARVAPNGVLWIPRTRAHTDSTPTFDLIDATGQLVGRVSIPKRARLAGFGKRVVYLVRVDDDDLEYLQRYRWP